MPTRTAPDVQCPKLPEVWVEQDRQALWDHKASQRVATVGSRQEPPPPEQLRKSTTCITGASITLKGNWEISMVRQTVWTHLRHEGKYARPAHSDMDHRVYGNRGITMVC